MLTKFMFFRHQTFTISQLHFPKLFSSSPILSTLLSTTISPSLFAVAAASNPNSISTTYGPSLQKGACPLTPHKNPYSNFTLKPSQNPQFQIEGSDGEGVELGLFDEGEFIRVFEITAIRVPSEKCYYLENKLRGHLLNWPRISNVARVPGDKVDSEVVELIKVGNGEFEGEEEVEKAVSRRVYGKGEGDGEELSGVLYRDKLAKEFNAKGFVNFRNLAKISRPSKRKKKRKEGEGEEGSGEEGEKRVRKVRSVSVEVIEERDNVGEFDGDLSGLLGEEFKGRKWRGPTRLLLLDEKYAGRKIDELPEAVKVVFSEDSTQDSLSRFELVKCKLTLSYDFWSADEVLAALLPKEMIIPSAFETVGHVAHLNLKDEHLPYKKIIAKVLLDKNKPKIQTVVNKTEAISNDFRTMQLEVLAGNHSLVTTVIENGLRFQLDLSTVYWNSRLATERQRLLSCFSRDDVLCDVFSGVGPIAISAAKKVKRVYANDLNPYAVDYLERNSVLNKLERKIKVFHMDGRRFIETMFSRESAYTITHVVMNLPNNAVDYLDAFRGIFHDWPKDRKLTLPTIHVYGFSRAEDPEFDFHERIRAALGEAAFAVEMRCVRQVAPGKWMLCASFKLPERVAVSKDYVDCKRG